MEDSEKNRGVCSGSRAGGRRTALLFLCGRGCGRRRDRTGNHPKGESGGFDASGGELQRFMLLHAYFSSPPILLLDEPCTGLDPERSHQVSTLLLQAKAAQKLVIYTSHTSASWVDQSISLDG